MIKRIILTCIIVLLLSAFKIESIETVNVSKYDTLKFLVDENMYEIVYSIIYVESGWDENAVSNTNDYGLMQINKNVWKKHFDWNRIMDVNYNISSGLKILNLCLDASNGDMHKALILYNGSSKYPYKIYNARKTLFGK